MISDRERREAVRNIRKWLDTPFTERPRAYCNDMLQQLGVLIGARPGENIYSRVADLIDRPTCRNTSGYRDVFRCSRCGVIKLDGMVECINGPEGVFTVPFQPIYCPCCGAEVVDDE